MEKKLSEEFNALYKSKTKHEARLAESIEKLRALIENNLIGKCYAQSLQGKIKAHYLFESYEKANFVNGTKEPKVTFMIIVWDAYFLSEISEKKDTLNNVLRLFIDYDMQEAKYEDFIEQFSLTESQLLHKIQLHTDTLQTNTEKQDETK